MADQWLKGKPAGTDNASDIDTLIQVNNAALDRLNYLTRNGTSVAASTSSTVLILPGAIAIPNSDGSVVRWRRNTSNVSLTLASDLDTGSEASSTQYYVYATADVDETTFRGIISTNTSAPSGFTYYRKIGYLYNNSSSDIVNVGNIKEGNVPNLVYTSSTTDDTLDDAAYGSDLTGLTTRFVCSGRPIRVYADMAYERASGTVVDVALIVTVDGTEKTESERWTTITNASGKNSGFVSWVGEVASGAHTIDILSKVSFGTATALTKQIWVEEL